MSEEFPTPQLLNEIEGPPAQPSQYGRVAKDILAGTVGGISQVLVGQPFDTTKVRLQTSRESTSVGQVVSTLFKQEGVAGFYKGTLTPLLGVGVCVSLQFGVNESMKRFFRAINGETAGNPMGSLPLYQYYICGFTGGVVNSFLACPIEHVRIRLQTQTHGATNALRFEGPLDCIRQLRSRNMLMLGLFPTTLRAGLGLGTYFLVYETLVLNELKKGKLRSEIETWKLCLFGALSGTSLWISIYPLDVIKSVIQTDDLRTPRIRNSMLRSMRSIYQRQGLKTFFQGFTPTMLRAAPANAATFVSFEVAMRLLG